MNNEDNNLDLPKTIEEVNNDQQISNIPVLEKEVEINDMPSANNNVQIENLDMNVEKPLIATDLNNNMVPEFSGSAFPNEESIKPEVQAIPDLEQEKVVTEELVEPVLSTPQPVIESVNNEPDHNVEQEVKLEKKLVVEKPIKKNKEGGNALVGFFALLLILAIILAAIYYFISQGIFELPNNVKLPFNLKPTQAIIPSEENDNDEIKQELTLSITGNYVEEGNNICPDLQVSLLVNEDNTFVLNDISFNEENNECLQKEITGTLINNNNKLSLNVENEETIIGSIKKENEEHFIKLVLHANELRLNKVQ